MRAKAVELIRDPLDLSHIAAGIRASSNFRFSWQWFRIEGCGDGSAADVRSILDTVVASPHLHRFLSSTFEPMYVQEFEIGAPHEHARVEANSSEFENLLAAAAGDHLGAYSRHLREATQAERREIQSKFGELGAYRTYQLLPGDVKGCGACSEYNNHLFSTWFYGVAWDWCLFAWWLQRELFWMGCLTDTD